MFSCQLSRARMLIVRRDSATMKGMNSGDKWDLVKLARNVSCTATQWSSQILHLNAHASPSELLSLPFSLTCKQSNWKKSIVCLSRWKFFPDRGWRAFDAIYQDCPKSVFEVIAVKRLSKFCWSTKKKHDADPVLAGYQSRKHLFKLGCRKIARRCDKNYIQIKMLKNWRPGAFFKVSM